MNKQFEALEAFDFLNCHPALGSDLMGGILEAQAFCMYPVCEHGQHIGEPVRVTKSNPKYVEFYRMLLEDGTPALVEANEDEDISKEIRVPYEMFYGHKWSKHHAEYMLDICLYIFDDSHKEERAWQRRENWELYGGEHTTFADTFEDMLILAAEKVRRDFGDFNQDSFLTQEEKDKKHGHYEKFVNGDDLNKLMDEMKISDVDAGVLSRRWLTWFKTTETYEKGYKGVL